MLQVKPSRRPSTKELLELNEVKTKIDQFYFEDTSSSDSKMGIKNSLLNTIKLPKDFIDLTRKLPKSNYSYDNRDFLPKSNGLGDDDDEVLQDEDDIMIPNRKINQRSKISRWMILSDLYEFLLINF